MRLRRLLVSMMVVALAGPAVAAAAAEPGVRDLKVVGHTDLGGSEPLGAVAVVGATAIVGTTACVPGPVTVVSLDKRRRPRTVGTIPLPAGTAAVEVDAVAVDTRAFTGDLVAIALDAAPSQCPVATTSGRGVLFYDVTRPAEPTLLARHADISSSVSLAKHPDGRLLALAVGAGVRVVDVSNPQSPVELADWVPPQGGYCRHGRFLDGGQRALVTCGPGGVHQLDLANPAAPQLAGRFAEPDRSGGGAPVAATDVLLGDRRLVLVSEDATDQTGALRVLTVEPPGGPERDRLRSPAGQPPGRVVASGQLAFVAWHADGLRVIDLGSPGTPVIARFMPPGPAPDVVDVRLLPNHLVVIDAASGLWVVERPGEGTKDSNSDDIKVLLAALGIGGLLALLVVPRVVTMFAMAGQAVGRPVAARVRRAR